MVWIRLVCWDGVFIENLKIVGKKIGKKLEKKILLGK